MEIVGNGKVLYVDNNEIIVARGYRLYKLDVKTGKRRFYAKVSDDSYYGFFSRFKLLRRLMRAEITAYYVTDEAEFCVAKKGIFRKKHTEKNFTKIHAITRGSKPLNICFDKGVIFFGEYFANVDKDDVHVYSSEDCGDKWKVVYTFSKGEINHIHGIFKDIYEDKIWVVTGDRENECIIGYTENHFQTFDIVFRGGQQFRTCNLFFYQEFITFVTDSQYEENQIKYFDRATYEITDICSVQSSVIKGVQSGNVAMFSTAIEPSEVNQDSWAHIWYSKDGKSWTEVVKDKKDCYPMLFQFGSFEFPSYSLNKNINAELYFTGRALIKTDNKICKIKTTYNV